MLTPDRWDAWLDPARTDPDDAARGCWRRRPPGLMRAYPVSTRGQQRAQQRAGAAGAAARAGGGDAVLNADDRRPLAHRRPADAPSRSTPRPATPGSPGTGAAGRAACSPSGTAPAAGSSARDLVALAAALPAARGDRRPGRAALAGGRPEGRARPDDPGHRLARAVARAGGAGPAGRRRRPQRRRPGRLPHGAGSSAPPPSWRWPSRCTRRAGRRSPGRTNCWRRPGRRTAAGGAGRPRPVRPTRASSPPGHRPVEVPDADHGFAVPKSLDPHGGAGRRGT